MTCPFCDRAFEPNQLTELCLNCEEWTTPDNAKIIVSSYACVIISGILAVQCKSSDIVKILYSNNSIELSFTSTRARDRYYHKLVKMIKHQNK